MLSPETQNDVQIIRHAGTNRIVHITTHQNLSSETKIVLWSDVTRVFRNALYLQHGLRVLPFLKGNDFTEYVLRRYYFFYAAFYRPVLIF